jgi:hypothetical protein
MPLSYHGFGPVAILVMIACIVVAEMYKGYRHRRQHH